MTGEITITALPPSDPLTGSEVFPADQAQGSEIVTVKVQPDDWYSKDSYPINLLDYGYLVDAASLWTRAIRQAYADAVALERALYCPTYYYQFLNPDGLEYLLEPADGYRVNIYGDGYGHTVFTINDRADMGFMRCAGVNPAPRLSGFTIQCNFANQSVGYHAILMNSGYNLNFRDIEIVDAGKCGLALFTEGAGAAYSYQSAKLENIIVRGAQENCIEMQNANNANTNVQMKLLTLLAPAGGGDATKAALLVRGKVIIASTDIELNPATGGVGLWLAGDDVTLGQGADYSIVDAVRVNWGGAPVAGKARKAFVMGSLSSQLTGCETYNPDDLVGGVGITVQTTAVGTKLASCVINSAYDGVDISAECTVNDVGVHAAANDAFTVHASNVSMTAFDATDCGGHSFWAPDAGLTGVVFRPRNIRNCTLGTDGTVSPVIITYMGAPPILSKSATYTATNADIGQIICVTTGASALELNLPAPGQVGRQIWGNKADAGGSLAVKTGATTLKTLTAINQTVLVVDTGSAWLARLFQ